MKTISQIGKSNFKQLQLGYWNYPGKAQHVRLLLEYCQIPYQEKTYTFGKKDEWFQQDKKNLGLNFPNLPYIQDPNTGISITESSNIMGYIADLSNEELRGKGLDKYVVDNIRFMLDEIGGQGYVSSIKAADKKAEDWEKKYSPKFNYLKNVYGDKLYATGYLTIADFYVFQRISDFKSWYPEQYEKEFAQTFDKILNNLSNLDGIKQFMASDRYINY